MSLLSGHINELKAAEAFTLQSGVFDKVYGSDVIIKYKRKRVRQHVLERAKPGGKILELNCGTGEDAIYFSRMGFQVHATDISLGMLNRMKDKICKGSDITSEQCSFTELALLNNRGPFNLIFSNFGGLNCTGDLKLVLDSFDALLVPGGQVTLVIISNFCFWETLLVFKGKFKTAFRRFFSGKRKAKLEGKQFTCWYYSPSFVIRSLKNFELVSLEGLCTVVPPSYMEGFAEKYPKLFLFLTRVENRLKCSWPWKISGDYFILTMQKKFS